MAMRDPIAAVVIFALSATMFVLSFNYGGGSQLFPRWISGAMIICSIALFIRGFISPTDDERMNAGEIRRVALSIVLTLAYVALIVPIGFFTASLIYLPLAAYALGLRRHVLIWVTTIIYVFGIYYLFARIFYTPLPRELIFRLL
jgi:putative tricarboxylic transport membrane protein